jgi:hypothetical protein
MQTPGSFWQQTVTTPLLCERYRLLCERRRLPLEVMRLEARLALVSPAEARRWRYRREELTEKLSTSPQNEPLEVLWDDVQALYRLLMATSQRWVALGSP